MPRYKPETREMGAYEAIENFYSDIADLLAEVQEGLDNVEGTGLENTDRNRTMRETADALENIGEMPELDDDSEPLIRDVRTTVTVVVRGGRRRGQESRATRCGNAVSQAQAGVDAIMELVEAQREECKEGEAADAKNEEDASEGALELTKSMREELWKKLDAIEAWCDEIRDHISEAESADFPGMRG